MGAFLLGVFVGMDRFRLTIVTAPRETALPLRSVFFLDGDFAEEQKIVFCPFRSASTGLPDCLLCTDFERLHLADAVICAREPPMSDAQALALVADRRICTGSESLAARTPLGAIAEAVVVCATAPTKIAVAERVVSNASSHGIVVVDASRRPIAFVSRSRLTRTPASELTIAECQDDAFSVFDEREPLSHALERLIHDRQRAAITVDTEGRVTGLVWDLAVLRWLARAAHGHMSHD